MYHDATVIPDEGQLPEVRLNKAPRPFAVIDLDSFKIQLPGRMSAAEQAAWLRSFAKSLTDLAEILDALDAPRIAREQREGATA